jgi:hypothetical protein
LTGQGVAAEALRKVGGVVAKAAPGQIGRNIVRDAFDLPTQTIPAVYLPIAGMVEAAKGNPQQLERLWADYKKIGVLPAVAARDPGRALRAIKNHPLFAALEVSGVRAAVGRGAGAVARAARVPRTELAREPLQVGVPGHEPYKREYSRDLFEQGVQRARDRRRQRTMGGQRARQGERERIVRERVDRIVNQEEGARRAGREAEMKAAAAAHPGRRHEAGVSFGVQAIARTPAAFRGDLAEYGTHLDQVARETQQKMRTAATGEERVILRDRLKATQATRKAVGKALHSADPERVFESARANVDALRQIDAELVDLGLLTAKQAERARAIPFAALHRGTPATDVALAEMERQGVRPGFVSQRPGARGPGSFWRSMVKGGTLERESLPKRRRTGKATVEGTFDPAYQAVMEQRVRGRGIIDAVRGFDRTVREFAVGGRRYPTFKAAQEAALHPDALGLPPGETVRPVRLGPLRATQEELARAEELFGERFDPQHQMAMETLGEHMLQRATQEGAAGEGPVVLVPESVLNRLREHYQPAGPLRRGMQVLSTGFKGAVLPTSPNWLLGNALDLNMRTALSGTTPYGLNAWTGRRLMRSLDRLDPEMAKRVRAGLVPGTLFGIADTSRVFRDARQFSGSSLGPLARVMGSVARAPTVRNVVNGFKAYRDAVFHFNERFLERQAQYAMLGKAARHDVRVTTGRWTRGLRLGDEAVEQLANGLLHTPQQIRYAKFIEETLGQWTANSPAARQFLVDYAPFGMWSRAATKFVLFTLPAKHPIKTALAAIAYEATEHERNQLGLSYFAGPRMRGGERLGPLPTNLQGSVPIPSGGIIAPQSLTSFGYMADIQKNLSSGILPQFPLQELAGIDWTGQQLTRPDGSPLPVDQRLGVVLRTFGESFVPFLNMSLRVGKDGPIGILPRTVRPYSRKDVRFLRTLSTGRQITVPAKPAPSSPWDSSSWSTPWRSSGGGSSDGFSGDSWSK